MTKEELLQTYFYIEDISGSENTVSITKNNANAPTLNLEYSTDGSTWTTATMNSDTTANTFTIPANGKLYLRGVNDVWGKANYYNKITATGNHNVGGNIMSLLYGSEFIGKTTFPTTINNYYLLSGLFYKNTNLVNVQDLQLSATTLAQYCYQNMFYGCNSLTTAPELPATKLAQYCYYYMFYGCNSLTTAPELPATKLANSCYYYMFSGTNVLPDCSNIDFTSETVVKSGGLKGLFAGTKVTDEDLMEILPINPETEHYYLPVMNLGNRCYYNMFNSCTSLTTAPELPATTLMNECYHYMFQGCTSLTTVPDLPATTLATQCYRNMFAECSSLITAPALPATTLATQCYEQMFGWCSSLTTAPVLPATTLADKCYSYMFINCSNLTTAPELPATTLASYCYSSMFINCSNLTTAPELPATTLASYCYSSMFSGCRKLNYIKADFIDYSNNNSEFSNWVQGVSSTGTFVMNPEATYDIEQIRGVNGIPSGWTVTKAYTNTHIYIVNQSKNINTLIINNNGSDLQYLVDMATEWVTLPTSKESQRIEFQYGITLKGNNTSLNGCKIKTSNNSTLNGSIMALLYGDDYEDKVTFPEGSKNTFKYLFLGYDKLTNISKLQLPATTLAPHCYQHMFTSCKSLKTIPELPAQNLTDSCYHGMFMNCDGIDKVKLPETYLAPYAYSNMFLGSDNLSDVTVTYKDDVDETNYKGWLKGVKTNGKFTYNNTEEVDDKLIRSNYYVPGSWDINYRNPNINYFYIEDISGEPNVFSINK